MKLKLYQIDAFAEQVFTGNPAAVCILEEWLAAELMQQIAAENNLAETAFAVKKGEEYEIRWFTPTVEVDLCGHATLATAFVIFEYHNHPVKEITFQSARSGKLTVERTGKNLVLDFPSDEPTPTALPNGLAEALGAVPIETLKGNTDYLLVYENQQVIEAMEPDMAKLKQIAARGIIVTAKGDDFDFVSRFFAPQSGIDEDPVTGSAHTTLIPYWAKKLEKNALDARQLSKRGGNLKCELLGQRVKIAGQAVAYLQGEIAI